MKSNLIRFAAGVATAGMILGSTMTVQAQPVAIGDVIFDAEYYAAHNPDVAAVFGGDANILFQHYIGF